MHCKDCKFWNRDGVRRSAATTGTCERVEWENSKRPTGDAAFLFADAHDDSGLRAELRTGPEFGCLKFQKG